MGRKARLLLAVTSAAVLALGIAPGPAQAASTGEMTAVAQETATDDRAICIFTYDGHDGRGWCDSIMPCPWEEWFVISETSKIWHIWPGSGGWQQMPNNGRANDTWKCYRNGNGQRQVEVLTANSNVYYSYYHNGAWRGWYYYPDS